MYQLLPRRRPFLFTINKRHNGEQSIVTEIFYLEPNQNRKAFVDGAKEYIKNIHGSGLVISYQEIKL